MKVARIQNFKEAIPFYSNDKGGIIRYISKYLYKIEDFKKNSKIYIGKELSIEDKITRKYTHNCVFIGNEIDSSINRDFFKFKDSEGNIHKLHIDSFSWSVNIYKFRIHRYTTEVLTVRKYTNNVELDFKSNGYIDSVN